MKIKVCGMRDAENISELVKLKPDFIGFIFYNKSKRFVENFPEVDFPEGIKKVGVFVNETIENILEIVYKYQLDLVQLHGNESSEFCEKLINMFTQRRLSEKTRHSELVSESHKLEIIKAFSVDEHFNFESTVAFEKSCDYFLFDTKGTNYGGNGVKFNWDVLQKYKGKTPFLLSGGISKDDVDKIQKIRHSAFLGVDINSGFEIGAALKNIDDIKEFKYNLL